MSSSLPRRQRVAAYAVILRDDRILLSQVAPHISPEGAWTLPGGGVDHGENPRDALLREIVEETGLDAMVGETARVYSAHLPGVWREGKQVDAHALRIVYDAWVPVDAPEPRVVEVDGSTVAAAWHPLADVDSGRLPVTALVREALADHRPYRLQRAAAYAVIRRRGGSGDEVLLVRISERGAHTGSWTLPGGGIDHGEPPAVALEREVREETGLACEVGPLLDVHDLHFSGTAPSGRHEDYHGIHLLFAATLSDAGAPLLVEVNGTTDAVRWVAVADILAGRVEVLDVVRYALGEALPGPSPT